MRPESIMITFLKIFFLFVLISMVVLTLMASLERDIVSALQDLAADGWFRATLADAYFGFLTFFCWVAYKERGILRRVVWFAAIMLLGNIAMAVYVLSKLFGEATEGGLQDILLQQEK